jgi:hypothetical protein
MTDHCCYGHPNIEANTYYRDDIPTRPGRHACCLACASLDWDEGELAGRAHRKTCSFHREAWIKAMQATIDEYGDADGYCASQMALG